MMVVPVAAAMVSISIAKVYPVHTDFPVTFDSGWNHTSSTDCRTDRKSVAAGTVGNRPERVEHNRHHRPSRSVGNFVAIRSSLVVVHRRLSRLPSLTRTGIRTRDYHRSRHCCRFGHRSSIQSRSASGKQRRSALVSHRDRSLAVAASRAYCAAHEGASSVGHHHLQPHRRYHRDPVCAPFYPDRASRARYPSAFPDATTRRSSSDRYRTSIRPFHHPGSS
uniref:Putative secreted protein n=1 Tax=Anopheles darlingi TaxID=43151 RepID=A0A2M4D665_ANODA